MRLDYNCNRLHDSRSGFCAIRTGNFNAPLMYCIIVSRAIKINPLKIKLFAFNYVPSLPKVKPTQTHGGRTGKCCCVKSGERGGGGAHITKRIKTHVRQNTGRIFFSDMLRGVEYATWQWDRAPSGWGWGWGCGWGSAADVINRAKAAANQLIGRKKLMQLGAVTLVASQLFDLMLRWLPRPKARPSNKTATKYIHVHILISDYN